MVGISLLTLVPGELGGSETYVRELLRGLGRVGRASTTACSLPPVAPDAGEGLPAEVATRVPVRAHGAAAARGDADGTLRPGPLRRRARGRGRRALSR